jgi:hypothetical protein
MTFPTLNETIQRCIEDGNVMNGIIPIGIAESCHTFLAKAHQEELNLSHESFTKLESENTGFKTRIKNADRMYNRVYEESVELKDRIEELSSKESSQRTTIEKALLLTSNLMKERWDEKWRSDLKYSIVEIVEILEGKDEPFVDTKASLKPKLEGKP